MISDFFFTKHDPKSEKQISKVPELYQIDGTKSGREEEEFDKDGSDLNIYN